MPDISVDRAFDGLDFLRRVDLLDTDAVNALIGP